MRWVANSRRLRDEVEVHLADTAVASTAGTWRPACYTPAVHRHLVSGPVRPGHRAHVPTAASARRDVQPDETTSLAGQVPLTSIEPSHGWAALRLGELWEYRELLYFLIWRDVKVRYKQTALGVAWAMLQPLLAMFVFSLFFGRLAHMGSDGLPYPVFNLAGLVPWTFFAFGLNEAANSLVGSRHLITKVYFPRLAIPLATVLAGLVDFAIAFLLLLVVMGSYGILPGVQVLLVIPLVLLTLVTALGVGLWLAALNVQYRDIRYVLPFLTQLWLFATPIVYPSSLVPATWRPVYGLNPMVGVVDGFRWALLGTQAPGATLVVSALAAVVLCAGGALYFRRRERGFADVV
jgi:lipopolysaccharide transport system permease protein